MMTSANLTLREEAYRLAEQLFGSEEAGGDFANQLIDICTRARGKDFLIVHNPGGWGHARLGQCLEWERSIVEGIKGAIEEMGNSLLLTQYFRRAVMRQLGGLYPVYSIELGFPFQYKSRRIITPRTLAMDSNGVRPDVLAQGNFRVGARILMAAPFKWVWYRLRGRRVAFAHCVSAPGHEYDWDNSEIQKPI